MALMVTLYLDVFKEQGSVSSIPHIMTISQVVGGEKVRALFYV